MPGPRRSLRSFASPTDAIRNLAGVVRRTRPLVAAYLGRGDPFDRALAEFAEANADQNERDYAAVVEAVESGRIAVEAVV